MRQRLVSAFTLVELIVVITILAILGTLGFISLSGYSKDARNSSRVSDMKIIQKGLDLHITTIGALPLPDDGTAITYSGGLAWTQGYFGETARTNVKRVSNVPLDPNFNIPYAYSVLNNRKSYQLAGLLEGGGLLGSLSPSVSHTYALSNPDFSSYNLGNYIDHDVAVNNDTECYVIAAPSIILSDIPAGGVLENNTPYNYTYYNSPHVAYIYSGSIDNSGIAPGFQNIEVFSGCEITDIAELELYNAQLSTAYQEFAGTNKYQELIFNSRSNSFMLASARSLQNRGISINNQLLNELLNPAPLQNFSDSFTATGPISLVDQHIPDDGGTWLNVPGGDATAYSVIGDVLQKNNASISRIYPRPNPNIISTNYSVNFDIIDFSGGTISIYLRYIDNNNYYRVELRPDGYRVYQNLGGVESTASNVTETIANGSSVIFAVETDLAGDNISLSIAGNSKGTNVLSGVNAKGQPVIWLENTGAQIDNYTLSYK